MSMVLVLMVVGFLALLIVLGRGPGLLRAVGKIKSVVLASIDHSSVINLNHGNFTNVVFLHHSVGRNLIEQGKLRERFSAAGYQFWDHDYNEEGFHRPDGSRASYTYNIPGDNTDPDGLAAIFKQPVFPLPLDTFSGLLQHEVIIFKSCFPVSDITSDAQLSRYKSYYLEIREVIKQHPDRIFIILTPPPLNPAETSAEAAARARKFANWLQSEEYLSGYSNMFTFDLFGSLAGSDPTSPDYNMLRQIYRDGTDSHPNQVGSESVAPQLVNFVNHAVRQPQAGVEK